MGITAYYIYVCSVHYNHRIEFYPILVHFIQIVLPLLLYEYKNQILVKLMHMTFFRSPVQAILGNNKIMILETVMVCTYWLSGRAGRENIWPEVMVNGPSAMTECHIFSCPARPNSVNKHFIIWPPRFCFFFSCDPSRSERLFPDLLTPSRTALIRGFSQYFCNESACGAVRVI